MVEKVILVDEKDKPIGTEEKLEAHRMGLLHRAFSIIVLNPKKEVLLQKRARTKYHSGGLWSNTCCSHPRQGEEIKLAVHRRLQEEMGFDCELKEVGSLLYKKEFGNGLTEHEFLHVFLGKYDGKVKPDANEAEDIKWVSLKELKRGIEKNPERYTYWLPLALEKIKNL